VAKASAQAATTAACKAIRSALIAHLQRQRQPCRVVPLRFII